MIPLLILILFGVQSTHGASPGQQLPSVQQLTRSADVVVIGKVLRLRGEWDPSRTNISTQVEVQIEEMLKGTLKGDRLNFSQPGGRVGEMAAFVGGTPSFTQGERVLLFLSRRRNTSLGIIGLFQGKFTIQSDEGSGREIAVRREPDSDRVLDRLLLVNVKSEILETLGR